MLSLTPAAAARDGSDPIFRLHAEAVRRARAGESILNATLGALVHDDGRLATMPTASETLANVPAEIAAGYAPISGEPAFLSAVIRDTFGQGPLADHAAAVATPGCTGALHSAITDCLEPGQAALTSSHYWGSYRAITSYCDRRIETFEMFDGDLRFDLDAFERGLADQLDGQGRALVLFNFPCHNPTGYSLDDGEWEAVSTIVRDAGRRGPVGFLLDNAYAAFGSGENRWVDHVPRMLETATVLVGWTASKTFALYGARVGALIALAAEADDRDRLESALGFSCRATWSNCNHAGQHAVTRLLTEPELAARVAVERAGHIALLHDRVAAFNEAAGSAGLAHPRYEGGFFVAVFTPDSETTAAAMRENGVYVLPMPGAVRVALCATPAVAIPRLVESLSDGVRVAGGAPGG
jgi:aromatic-amino-acid transaminase